MTKSCIVVDDEPEIRSHVGRLAKESGLRVLGEAGDGLGARELLSRVRPDILFIDIKMPGLSGLELLAMLRDEPSPPVAVLVTAYEDYALAAFELSAIDYVTKPIDRARFALAARRAIEQAQGRHAVAAMGRVKAILSESRPAIFAFREGASIVNLKPEDVSRFEAKDDYVEACTQRRTYLLSARLAALAMLLPSPPFLQVHRSHLVNLDHVERLRFEGGRMILSVSDGADLSVSRTRAAEVKRQLLHRN
jgi:two-component system, LytTR family, response regulator